MDDVYDSPDSDGHESIPPADSTLEYSRYAPPAFPKLSRVVDSSDDEQGRPPALVVPRRRPTKPTGPRSIQARARILMPMTDKSNAASRLGLDGLPQKPGTVPERHSPRSKPPGHGLSRPSGTEPKPLVRHNGPPSELSDEDALSIDGEGDEQFVSASPSTPGPSSSQSPPRMGRFSPTFLLHPAQTPIGSGLLRHRERGASEGNGHSSTPAAVSDASPDGEMNQDYLRNLTKRHRVSGATSATLDDERLEEVNTIDLRQISHYRNEQPGTNCEPELESVGSNSPNSQSLASRQKDSAKPVNGGLLSDMSSLHPASAGAVAPPLGVMFQTQDDSHVIFDHSSLQQQIAPPIPASAPQSSVPAYPYHNFNIWKFKNSESARRVSIHTPSTHTSLRTTTSQFLDKNPPTPLDPTDFQFPKNPFQMNGLSIKPSALASKSWDQGRLPGSDPPPNTAHGSPPITSYYRQMARGSAVRKRSKSDPVGTFVESNEESEEDKQRPLFNPARVRRTNSDPSPTPTRFAALEPESPDDAGDQESTPSDSVQPLGQLLDTGIVIRTPPAMASTPNHPSQEGDASQSLRLGDVSIRVQTPVSIDDEGINRVSREEAHDFDRGQAPHHRLHMQTESSTLSTAHEIHLVDQQPKTPEGFPERNINKVEDCTAPSDAQMGGSTYSRSDQLLQERLRGQEALIHHLEKRLRDQDQTVSERELELQHQLEEAKNAHRVDIRRTEAKYAAILSERDGEINHLQAELDELVNLMPVDQSSRITTSRIFDDPEGQEWVEGRSHAELTGIFEESLDNIIAEIQGGVEDQDYDEAVQQAEVSLRRLAIDAGYVANLDKAALAAFGIRHLKDEKSALKDLLEQSEGRARQLMEANDTSSRAEQMLRATVNQLTGERTTLQTVLEERRTKVAQLEAQLHTTQIQLRDESESMRKSNEMKDTLRVAEERVKVLEVELASLKDSRTCLQTELDKVTFDATKTEAHSKEREAEVARLRRELNVSTERTYSAQAEVSSLKQRLSDASNAVEGARKQKQAAAAQIRSLESQLNEQKASTGSLSRELSSAKSALDDLRARLGHSEETRMTLDEKLKTTALSVTALSEEKASLMQATRELDEKWKVAQSQLDQYRAESERKESVWENLKTSLENKLHDLSLRNEDVSPYEKALYRIAGEFSHSTTPGDWHAELVEELAQQEIAKPKLTATILQAVKSMKDEIEALDDRAAALEQKNARLKAAIKRWGDDSYKEKARVEKLLHDNKELILRLKAEKQQGDEKIGQLILALRR